MMGDYFPSNAQWFENTERSCVKCGKRATGILRSDFNADLGPYCKRCADRAIKLAHRGGRFLPDERYAPTPEEQ